MWPSVVAGLAAGRPECTAVLGIPGGWHMNAPNTGVGGVDRWVSTTERTSAAAEPGLGAFDRSYRKRTRVYPQLRVIFREFGGSSEGSRASRGTRFGGPQRRIRVLCWGHYSGSGSGSAHLGRLRSLWSAPFLLKLVLLFMQATMNRRR